MRVLVVNAGSSSLRLQVLAGDDSVVDELHLSEWDGDRGPAADWISGLDGIEAVGHRVVHGGTDLRSATVVDDEIVTRIEVLTPLAPLHQSRAVAGIRMARELLPDAPSVACFDTAYHATLPEEAATYALPEEWRRRWNIRRFGFHGLSHAYAARRAASLLEPRPADRIVTCHLGAGASLCASLNGRSVDTTMGFTPLEGLVMATRSGSVDPGLLLWLAREDRLGLDELADGLEQRAGLAGLSGTSGDMREVLAARLEGDERAKLAYKVYIQRLAAEIARMAASMGGLDALVFTGGVGENVAELPAAVAERLHFVGVAVGGADAERADGDAVISPPDAAVASVVVSAREDLEIARQVREALAG